MKTKSERDGFRSPKYGHLGVYFLCTGPDPNGPRSGEQLKVVIYDRNNKIIRTLTQEKGRLIDPGYVDFFDSPKCRPSIHEYHIVDIGKDGKKNILATHTNSNDAHHWLQMNFADWAEEHGIKED